jgi:hypothetical protein
LREVTGPSTYFEWTNILKQFAMGDDSVLSDLERGSFAVDAGTVYRFYRKAQETYVERKKEWIDKFNRLFQIQYIKTESDISIVLQNAKANLQPIAKFIRLSAFPTDLQDTLKKDFEGFVAEVRKNIRESVTKNQPSNERILLIVNTFDFFESSLRSDTVENSTNEPTPGTIQKKGRIIF